MKRFKDMSKGMQDSIVLLLMLVLSILLVGVYYEIRAVIKGDDTSKELLKELEKEHCIEQHCK